MANDFLPFGTAGGANVMTQSAYAALASRLTGFVSGVALSAQLNKAWRQSSVMSAMIGEFIQDFGARDALDDGDVDKLEREFVRTLQRATFLLGVATGSANTWVLTPVPAVAAYAEGRPMIVIVPATNTSTTVNANTSGLGNRRVKKSDGTDPAVGDLIVGQMLWVADDGTNLRVLSMLTSDVAVQIAVNKSPFNVQQFVYSTRTPLSATGFTNFQTGSYTKKSATSDLVVRASTNLFSTATYAASIMRLVFGATTLEAVCGNSNTTSNLPSPTTERKISGVAAGAVAWTISFGRNDANGWSSVINPTTADDGGQIPASTATSIMISELEP